MFLQGSPVVKSNYNQQNKEIDKSGIIEYCGRKFRLIIDEDDDLRIEYWDSENSMWDYFAYIYNGDRLYISSLTSKKSKIVNDYQILFN